MTMKCIYFDTTRTINHNMAIENEYKKKLCQGDHIKTKYMSISYDHQNNLS